MHSPAPGGASALALADFNGDGLPDVAFASSPGTLSSYAIALNQGGGVFGSATISSLTLGVPNGVAAGDFNGDGKQDLAFGTGYVLGNGDGTFGAEQALPAGIAGFAVSDLNHDGFADLAYSLKPGAPEAAPVPLGVYVLSGSASGLASAATTIATDGFGDAVLLALDLDEDGNPDLIASVGDAVSLLFGDGKGNFSSPLSYSGTVLAFADMNGDGVLDLIETNSFESTPTFGIAYGNGDGTLQAPPLTLGANLQAIADMNGDGLPDAVAKVGNTAPQVYLSRGDGRFTPGSHAVFDGLCGLWLFDRCRGLYRRWPAGCGVDLDGLQRMPERMSGTASTGATAGLIAATETARLVF